MTDDEEREKELDELASGVIEVALLGKFIKQRLKDAERLYRISRSDVMAKIAEILGADVNQVDESGLI